jgi:hypothetical protein
MYHMHLLGDSAADQVPSPDNSLLRMPMLFVDTLIVLDDQVLINKDM